MRRGRREGEGEREGPRSKSEHGQEGEARNQKDHFFGNMVLDPNANNRNHIEADMNIGMRDTVELLD